MLGNHYIKAYFFQLCELHFQPADIRREMSYFDEKTGRKLTAKIKFPQLDDVAIPSILPNCPSYLSSSPIHSRESPDSRRTRMEETSLHIALLQSVADDKSFRKQRELHDLDELDEKLNFLDTKYWTVIKKRTITAYMSYFVLSNS